MSCGPCLVSAVWAMQLQIYGAWSLGGGGQTGYLGDSVAGG